MAAGVCASDHSNVLLVNTFFYFLFFLYFFFFFLAFCFIGVLYFPCPHSFKKKKGKKQHEPVLAVVIAVLVSLW